MANVTSGSVWVLDTAGTIVAAGTPVTIRSVRAILNANGGAKLLDGNSNAIWEDCSNVQQTLAQSAGYGGPLCSYDKPLTANGLVLQLYSCSPGKVYVQVEKPL